MWTLHGGCVVVLVVEQSSRQIEYFVVGKIFQTPKGQWCTEISIWYNFSSIWRAKSVSYRYLPLPILNLYNYTRPFSNLFINRYFLISFQIVSKASKFSFMMGESM